MAQDNKRPHPNVWMCYGAAAAGLSYTIWPEPGSYFASFITAGVLALAGFGAISRGLNHLRLDYRRRLSIAQSQMSSGVHGRGRFASVSERLAAGLHDPGGKMLLGLSDNIPFFLPDGLSLACQAPPGAGKSSALVSNAILHAAFCDKSVVVTDCKPELVYQWAEPLRKMGFRVIINNPGGV